MYPATPNIARPVIWSATSRKGLKPALVFCVGSHCNGNPFALHQIILGYGKIIPEFWSLTLMLARIRWLSSSDKNPAPMASGPTIVGPPGNPPPTVGESAFEIPAIELEIDASLYVCWYTGAALRPS